MEKCPSIFMKIGLETISFLFVRRGGFVFFLYIGKVAENVAIPRVAALAEGCGKIPIILINT